MFEKFYGDRIAVGWGEIAETMRVSGYEAEKVYGPLLDAAGYLLRRGVGRGFHARKPAVCAFESHLISIICRMKGTPEPPPPTDVVIRGTPNIARFMCIDYRTFHFWSHLMWDKGVLLTMHGKGHDVRGGMFTYSLPALLRAFLIWFQGGENGKHYNYVRILEKYNADRREKGIRSQASA